MPVGAEGRSLAMAMAACMNALPCHRRASTRRSCGSFRRTLASYNRKGSPPGLKSRMQIPPRHLPGSP